MSSLTVFAISQAVLAIVLASQVFVMEPMLRREVAAQRESITRLIKAFVDANHAQMKVNQAMLGIVEAKIEGRASEPDRSNTVPLDYVPRNIRQAITAVLHHGLEHADPSIRDAREQLYAAATYWPEDAAIDPEETR